MYRKVNDQTKQRLVRRYQAGEPIEQICRDSGVPRSTIYCWAKLYQVQTTDSGVAITPRELILAKRRIKKHEGVISVLKAVDCTATAPLKIKLQALEALYGKYSVHTLCDAMDVSRGTFYNHVKRNKRERAWYHKRRSTLMDAVRTAYEDSNQIYGAGKVRAVLVNQGYSVSEKYVSELMREMGLYSMTIAAKKASRELAWNARKANVLKRSFDVDRPNKVWVSDTTCYKLKGSHFHICVFLDLYSRKILSLAVGRNTSTHLVKKAFIAAYAARQPEELMIHTDRGTAYTSYSMQRVLKENGVAHSFSYKGSPHDNAVVESFFATLKKEELYRVKYMSEAEFRAALDRYVRFYNAKRPHQYLGYKTPEQVEVEFGQS